jgi:hypothetical protein
MGRHSSTFVAAFLTLKTLRARCVGSWSSEIKPSFLLLQLGLDLFVDATFSMTPHPLYQVLIIMAYCRQTGLYVPVVYCLMTHKTEAMYKRAIAELLSCAQLLDSNLVQLDVRNYASDFEAALFNACEHCFPNGVHIGCFFHFKQAIRKYMCDKCHFDTDTIGSFMEQVTLLTIIDPDEILIYGVPYLRQMFEPEGLDERTCEKWVKFWSYFERQWTKVTDPASWNIYKMNGEAKDFINRTNNPCENYNNRFL